MSGGCQLFEITRRVEEPFLNGRGPRFPVLFNVVVMVTCGQIPFVTVGRSPLPLIRVVQILLLLIKRTTPSPSRPFRAELSLFKGSSRFIAPFRDAPRKLS